MVLTKRTLSETKLWENGSPTSSFAGQVVTLNYGGITHKMTDYPYVLIKYRASASDSHEFQIMIPVSVFSSYVYGGGYPEYGVAATLKTSSSASIGAREVYYLTQSSVQFGGNGYLGKSGSANGYNIPIAILGLK